MTEEYKEIKKGNIVYWARVVPNAGIYDVIDIKIRTIANSYLVGIEDKTKHAYLFNIDDLEKILFFNRKDALNLIKEAEKHKKKISDEKFYEEY